MALFQFRPSANFSVKNRQILKIGKTGTLGFFGYDADSEFHIRFRIGACMRHFYQDYVNFTKIIKLSENEYKRKKTWQNNRTIM